MEGQEVDLIGRIDSNWAEDVDWEALFSTSQGDPFSGHLRNNPQLPSTVEAEYMVVSNATKEAIWLQVLLDDLTGQAPECASYHERAPS